MNLIDQLTQMQANGKSVVSITFILNSLESIERHECENCRQIEHNPIASRKKDFEIVWGGDSNRTLSKDVG